MEPLHDKRFTLLHASANKKKKFSGGDKGKKAGTRKAKLWIANPDCARILGSNARIMREMEDASGADMMVQNRQVGADMMVQIRQVGLSTVSGADMMVQNRQLGLLCREDCSGCSTSCCGFWGTPQYCAVIVVMKI